MLFEHASPQHLFGCHAVAAFGRIDSALATPTEILVHQRHCLGQLVEKVAHGGQLGGVHVGNGGWRQRELIE
jgi:hypothetical protein